MIPPLIQAYPAAAGPLDPSGCGNCQFPCSQRSQLPRCRGPSGGHARRVSAQAGMRDFLIPADFLVRQPMPLPGVGRHVTHQQEMKYDMVNIKYIAAPDHSETDTPPLCRGCRKPRVWEGPDTCMALAGETPIPTLDGWVALRDIEPGQTVLDEGASHAPSPPCAGVDWNRCSAPSSTTGPFFSQASSIIGSASCISSVSGCATAETPSRGGPRTSCPPPPQKSVNPWCPGETPGTGQCTPSRWRGRCSVLKQHWQ